MVLLAEAGQSGDRAAEGREQGGSTESTVGKEAEPGCTASRTQLWHEGKRVAPSLHHHAASPPAKAVSATRGDVHWNACVPAEAAHAALAGLPEFL